VCYGTSDLPYLVGQSIKALAIQSKPDPGVKRSAGDSRLQLGEARRAVFGDQPVDRVGPAELRGHQPAPPAKAQPQLLVVEESTDPLRVLRRIVGNQGEAGQAIFDDGWHATYPGGHHRSAAGARLEGHQAERLAV